MPIYVYQSVAEGCEHCRDGFEVLQASDDPPVAECPRCKGEVQKIPAGFRTGKSDKLSDKNLKEHGFSKLKRQSDGSYEQEV